MMRMSIGLVLCATASLGAPPEGQKSTRPTSMLPETPKDWRYERIAFPLAFAPDLKFEGYEELRFAPGMFDTESATYFTYIFAVSLEQVEKVDAAFVQSFLLKYYRGLCKAVAESRELDVDVDKVTVAVKRHEDERLGREVFHAAIDTFDTFTTGKPLKLNVEIVTAHNRASKTTCLFALASPKPKKDEVWHVLYGMRRGFTCKTASAGDRQ